MKKFVSAFLVLVFLFANCVASYATVETSYEFPTAGTCYVEPENDAFSAGSGPRGGRAATREQLEAISKLPKEVLTKEQLQRKSEFTSSGQTRANWIWLSGYIVYSQSTEANCGPACIQSALKYLTGSAPAQSVVARACNTTQSGVNMGTYVYDMVVYINSMQTRHTYRQCSYLSQDTFTEFLHTGITAYNAPPIIGMWLDPDDGWAYEASSHFMSVYGAMSDESRFALSDPWIGYAGITEVGWSYAMPANIIYDAYNLIVGMMY